MIAQASSNSKPLAMLASVLSPLPARRIPQVGDNPREWAYCAGNDCQADLSTPPVHVTEITAFAFQGGTAPLCPQCARPVSCAACGGTWPAGLVERDGDGCCPDCRETGREPLPELLPVRILASPVALRVRVAQVRGTAVAP